MGLVPLSTTFPDHLRPQIRNTHDPLTNRHPKTPRLAPRLPHVSVQRYIHPPSSCILPTNKPGYTQGGSNADIVLADAYIKNLTDNIDWAAGYTAVKKNAEQEPFDWSAQGRGGLDSWKTLHYIPVEDFDYVGFGPMTRSVSRTLEYAYNDFAVAQIARGMGEVGDAEVFEERAGYWRNLFREDQGSLINGDDTGFRGFFQPRFLNGSWGYQVSLLIQDLRREVLI